MSNHQNRAISRAMGRLKISPADLASRVELHREAGNLPPAQEQTAAARSLILIEAAIGAAMGNDARYRRALAVAVAMEKEITADPLAARLDDGPATPAMRN